jgi:hypothetical protein
MSVLQKIKEIYKRQMQSLEYIQETRIRTHFNFELGRTNLAFQLLEKLTSQGPYFPVTSPTINQFSILQVLNDMAVNDRKCFVEFGSGLSTLLAYRLKKMNQLSTRIVSVESDKDWLEFVKGLLEKEGGAGEVEFVYAPLVDCEVGYEKAGKWYDREAIRKALENGPACDIVLVDGPAAYNKDIMYARYPAFDCMKPYMADSFTFFLDDINREGELKILGKWAKDSGLEKIQLSATFGVITKNLRFHPFYQ